MFSGNRFPYDLPEGATVAQWLRAHSEAQPRPLRAVAATVPAEVADLVMAGLAKEPESRPTAADFAANLAPWASARPLGEMRHLHRGNWRRGRMRHALGYAVALVVGLAGGVWLSDRHATPWVGWAHTQASPPLTTTPAGTPVPQPPSATASRVSSSQASAMVPGTTPAPSRATSGVQLRVAFQAGLLRIANTGSTEADGLLITLRGADGVRHLARLPEPLTPGDEVFLAADTFSPPLTADASPVRAEIAVGDASAGGHLYTFPLASGGH
jgi:hypothetical protein